MTVALVVTTIASSDIPTIREFDLRAHENGWLFLAVGDVKTPQEFRLQFGEYMLRGGSDRREESFRLAHHLPDNSYSLKNLGYLRAMQLGASVLVETDDDNFPHTDFWSTRSPNVLTAVSPRPGWVNPYLHFSTEHVWPRGLPLTAIRVSPECAGLEMVYAPIQQGLADGDPDVDAIFRLVVGQQIHFDDNLPLALTTALAPMNSQNTTWFPEAFPLLYLPTYCSFRMTDIWRGFIAGAWLRLAGYPLVFHKPTMLQVRNHHDLMRDFALEVEGYLNYEAVQTTLESVVSDSDDLTPPGDFLTASYKALARANLVSEMELKLVTAWLSDLDEVR